MSFDLPPIVTPTPPTGSDGAYSRPFVSQYPTLLTYQDILDRLLNFSNAGQTATQALDYRNAVDESYREVVNGRVWKYFNTQQTIFLNAAYSTGTVTYTQSNLTVTLTGGTFPAWAGEGHIRIGTTYYQVYSRASGTSLVLAPANNPGADISTASTYILFQTAYRLPADYRGQFRWNVATYNWSNGYIEPQGWMDLMRRFPSGGTPRYWTVMADPLFIASYAIFLWPYPITNWTYGGIYQRKPRDLRVSGYDVANYDFSDLSSPATIANTGVSVTGTNTHFTSRHLGCVLRFGSTTKNPTGTTGLYPYYEQRVIVAINSATSVTLDTAPDTDYSGVRYTVSDPLDLSPGMLNAILDCSKFRYSLNKPLEDQRPLATLRGNYEKSYRVAKENDAMILSGRHGSGPTYDRMHDHTYDQIP